MSEKNISVKEIAELAGTSVATVSRVINQNGRFSKETERKVKEIIEKYDYKPNQLARGLRVSHTRVIGLMVPDITNEFFASITKEVQRNLLAHNYMTLICNSNEDVKEAKEQIQMFLTHKVSGIIYIGGDDIVESMDIPTLYIDRDPRDMKINLYDGYVMIECDNIQGGYLAGKELVEKGAKRIAFVCYNRELSTIKKRIQGFQKALNENGIMLQENMIIDAEEVSLDAGARVTEKILKLDAKVDGIFFTSDLLAVGGIDYLNTIGVKIPEQIRVMGFDDISAGKIVHPQLSTIHQPLKEFGKLAAENILAMIEGKDIEIKKYRLPVELIARKTT